MKICYWPNGLWCEASEVGQMTHLSDDFTFIEVECSPDDDLDEEGIEQLIKEKTA